jgi:paraquat-inducible protein B
MSDPGQVKPSLIGAFVLAGLLLAVVTVFMLSDRSLTRQSSKYLLYFEGDIKGLQVGAPVNFRGVKIGQVESMSIDYDSENKRFSIPVTISIEDRMVGYDGSKRSSEGLFDVHQLIRQGLRARLNLQSIITGKLEIELDMIPDSPLRLVGGANTEYPEIPTVQSSLEKITSALEELPLERITRQIHETLVVINRAVSDGKLERAMDGFMTVAENLERVTRQLESEMPQLLVDTRKGLTDSRALMAELDGTVRETRALLQHTGERLDLAFASWDSTMASGEASFEQVRQTAASADRLIRQDSPLITEMNAALRELTAAARSIRVMSDYLQRHPEALLQGKQ